MLLSNVSTEWADAAHLARGHYGRWRIETDFKLLKSHGLQLEDWRQETGPAIARRLLVGSMACETVWQLLADDFAPATHRKNILVRLSGRQMRRQNPQTAPARLAGLWMLLSMFDVPQEHDLNALKSLVAQVQLPIPLLWTG